MSPGLGPLVRKELTELRRDRRVLLLTLVLPVLLYPAVIGAMDRLQAQRAEQLREHVMSIAVTEGDPALRAALRTVDGARVLEAPLDTALAWVDVGRVALAVELPAGARTAQSDTLRLHGRFTRETTREAAARVERVVQATSLREAQRRFEELGGRGRLDRTLVIDERNLASVSAEGGAEASRLLVYLLLMTLFMAATTLATDMVAGEKERGTLETLFLAPLERSTIAQSKLLVVSLGTALTGVLSLASLALSYRMGWIGGAADTRLELTWPTLVSIALLLVPLAVLLGAVLLAVSSWARSLKEAQYFVLPVMLVVFVPALLSMSQAIELDPLVALLPIANVAFVMRDVLAQQGDPSMLGLVLASTLGWILVANRVVTSLLSREETVLGLDPEPFFARTDGGRRRAIDVGMALTVLGYFYGAQWLQTRDIVWGLAASLWLLLPTLAVLVALLVRPGSSTSWRERLSLRPAPVRALFGAVLLGWGVMLPMAGGLQRLQSYVLPMSHQHVVDFSAAFEGFTTPLLFLLAALSPAICEELVFRGAFLGMLREQRGPRAAIVLSSICFALIHLSIYRLLPTFLLGVLLAALTVRHRSLLPAMLMHLTYNGTLLLGARWTEGRTLPFAPDGGIGWVVSAMLLLTGRGWWEGGRACVRAGVG
jgi:sodium transport system permease protein